MEKKRLVIHEDDGLREPDICGVAIELINERLSTPQNVSLATIILDTGKTSQSHYHKKTEEIYYILEGTAIIVINGNEYQVKPGHAILLPLNSVHKIINTGSVPLKFVCADSPPFDSNDVFIDEIQS